jgi:hypothetical protein
MDHDDGAKSRPSSPKAPTEGEMSRIAREAVRQPADPRLDKELARMGLTDASEPTESQVGQPRARGVVIGAELERLRKDLRRVEVILWILVAAIGILAVLVMVLFVR